MTVKSFIYGLKQTSKDISARSNRRYQAPSSYVGSIDKSLRNWGVYFFQDASQRDTRRLRRNGDRVLRVGFVALLVSGLNSKFLNSIMNRAFAWSLFMCWFSAVMIGVDLVLAAVAYGVGTLLGGLNQIDYAVSQGLAITLNFICDAFLFVIDMLEKVCEFLANGASEAAVGLGQS